MEQKTVLHVGSGTETAERLHPLFRGEEWKELRLDIDPNVLPDIVNSITDMKNVEDNSVEGLWSSHNLEHLFAHEVPIALAEFFRVLKPKGIVLVAVPDIQAVAVEVAKGNLEDLLYTSPAGPISAIDVLWGFRRSISQGNHYMAHKTGFTEASLKKKMEDAGFRMGDIEKTPFGLLAVGIKPE